MWKLSDGTEISKRLEVTGESNVAEHIRLTLTPGATRTHQPPPGIVGMLEGHEMGDIIQAGEIDGITWWLRETATWAGVKVVQEPKTPRPDLAATGPAVPGRVY